MGNSGVVVFDLEKWRAQSGDLLAALGRLREKFPGSLGDQEYLNLHFQGEFDVLDWRWDMQGMCFGSRYPQRCLDEAKIFHFNGGRTNAKPWQRGNECGPH